MERVFGLDVLRALAIFCVLLSHSRFFLLRHFPSLKVLNVFGFLGVELFFVLSGFLIGGIVLKSLNNAPTLQTLFTFWRRRWFRTFPNYFLFLALNCLFIALTTEKNIFSWKYLVFLQNFAWGMSSLFPESWSLTVEEWFYIFFPTMAFLTILVTQKVRLSIFSTSIFLLVAISTLRFLYVIDKDPSWDEEVRKVMVLRLDTLMYGVLGASIKYYFKDVWSKYKKPATVVGFASLAVAISCFYGFDTDTSLFSRTFLFSITSFGVMCLLPTLDSYRTTKTNNFKRAIINTSLWSYSLYLSNYLIFQVLTTITQNMNKTPYASLATLVVWVLTTFAISGAVYKWYEEPIMKMREFSIFSSAIQVLRNNANKV